MSCIYKYEFLKEYTLLLFYFFSAIQKARKKHDCSFTLQMQFFFPFKFNHSLMYKNKFMSSEK